MKNNAIKHSRIIWTGDKHSGKTTAAKKLIHQLRTEGFRVGGLLAPSIYDNGMLVGFDILDIENEEAIPFASLSDDPQNTSRFVFSAKGLKFGQNILSNIRGEKFDLIIVDEFGRLELGGKGWREQVDRLIEDCNCAVMLITQTKLLEMVKNTYNSTFWYTLQASTPLSQTNLIKTLLG